MTGFFAENDRAAAQDGEVRAPSRLGGRLSPPDGGAGRLCAGGPWGFPLESQPTNRMDFWDSGLALTGQESAGEMPSRNGQWRLEIHGLELEGETNLHR